MHFNRIVARLSDAIGTVRSASHVAAAVEAHRRPDPAHLRRLGIDPNAFSNLGR